MYNLKTSLQLNYNIINFSDIEKIYDSEIIKPFYFRLKELFLLEIENLTPHIIIISKLYILYKWEEIVNLMLNNHESDFIVNSNTTSENYSDVVYQIKNLKNVIEYFNNSKFNGWINFVGYVNLSNLIVNY